MIYCIIAVIVILFSLVFTVIYLNAKNKDLQRKVKEKETLVLGAMKELNALKEEMSIRKQANEEADKKIDELHNGDSVSNAISQLSKHKGN